MVVPLTDDVLELLKSLPLFSDGAPAKDGRPRKKSPQKYKAPWKYKLPSKR